MLPLPPFLSRFLYDGARIQDDDTPASLDMKEGGVCKGPLFYVFEPLTHFFMFFRQIDTIDIMIFRKFALNIFENNSLKWFLFLLYLRGSLGLVAAFVTRIYLITFVPSRQVGKYR